MRRLAAVALLVMALGACSSARPDEDASGEGMYADLCARCHDADLSGGAGPPIGPGSNAADEDDMYLEFTISNGRGRMPSFSYLDDVQLGRLIAYIREVQDR